MIEKEDIRRNEVAGGQGHGMHAKCRLEVSACRIAKMKEGCGKHSMYEAQSWNRIRGMYVGYNAQRNMCARGLVLRRNIRYDWNGREPVYKQGEERAMVEASSWNMSVVILGIG